MWVSKPVLEPFLLGDSSNPVFMFVGRVALCAVDVLCGRRRLHYHYAVPRDIEHDFDKEVKQALLSHNRKSLQFSVEVVVVFSFIGIGYLVQKKPFLASRVPF